MIRMPSSVAVAAFAAAVVTSVGAQTPKPKHINRAIELLEAGQPVYYTGSHSGTDGTFEPGRRTRKPTPTTSATTWSTRRTTSKASPST